MKRAPRLVSATAFALLLALASSVMPQEKKKDNPKSGQDVVKLRAELVQIDVAVSDRNNRPVIGLKREDFELYDNNKLQTITHFSLEESTSTALRIEDDIETPRSLPRAITATELKRVFAFVVDTMHMKPENVYRARATLQDFLDKKMEPGDLVLILATAGGSGVFQQFTSDQRILRAAVARLRPFTLSSATTPFRSIGRSSTIGMPGRPSGPGFAGIDPFEEADARATLGTLNNMIRAMSTLPGRKISVFISEGFRLFSTRTSQDLDETIARAARANVVFYSIDPRGLDPLSLNASDDLGDEDLGSFLSRKRDDFRESQDSLNALAVDTGGKFFRNNNDIKQMLNSLIDGSSSYYLLGFQPADEKWDGKYHKIKVVVRNRPELRVSTRKGYLARSEPRRVYSDPKVGEMVEAINSPLVRRDIDLQLTPFYRDDAKRQVNLLSLLHIDATRLKFKEVDGKFATKLDLVGFILGPNGTPIDRFSNTVELNLKPETHKEILKRGLLSTRTTTVKAGIYQVRMFVRETDSGLIGTANNYVEIPDLKGDRLATSSIFLDPRYDAQGQKADDVGSSETLSQRRYRPGRQFGYALVVYNAKAEGKTNQPQLEVRTRILSSGRAAYDGKYHPVQIAEGSTPPSRIMTGGVMQLGALPRGEYTLEVTVKDKLVKKESRGFVRQEIDFSIE